MVDIVSILVDVLKIQCHNLSNPSWCSAPAAEAMFYLVLFPTAFILLLIYIITNFIFKGEGNGPKGLRLLISITIYAFIVMQGHYTLFVSLSNFWWILVITLIAVWALVRHFAGGGGQNGRGQGGAMGKIGGGVSGILKYGADRAKELGGPTGIEKKINDRIEKAEGVLNLLEKFPNATDVGDRMDRFDAYAKDAENLIEMLEKAVGFTGKKTVARTKKHWDRLTRITKRFKDFEKKHYKP